MTRFEEPRIRDQRIGIRKTGHREQKTRTPQGENPGGVFVWSAWLWMKADCGAIHTEL
jgi:hypothetical protein